MIFTHATVLTMNDRREIIDDGAVVVSGDRIEAVGKTADLLAGHSDHDEIDLRGHIVLPGLVNTHVHTAQCMLRGVSEGKRLGDFSEWLFGRIFPLQGSYTEEDGLASASLCVLEMIKSGTTGFVECLLAEQYGFDGIAEMCVESGIRAALGKIAMDVSPEKRDELGWHMGMWQTRESSIEGTIAAHDRWDGAGDGRLQVWFGCRSAEPAGNPTLYDEVSEVARERDMGITIHLAEFPPDNDYAREQGYRSHIEFAHGHGLLGPRTVLAHCTIADDADHRLLAATGTTVSHNPGNNAAAAWPAAPVGDMLAAGVNVAMGCDGAPSNANSDLLRDLRIACHIARGRAGSRLGLGSETVLEMATLNGARALGIDDQVGSIEAGKKADFITIDTDAPHLQPVWNPVATVVFAAQGGDVDTVVIDGRIVMQGRKVLTMDEAAILDDVRGRFHAVAERAGVEGIESEWPIT
ncbi:MAG: amidohydrolase [Acidimicrobiia bacterium]|nr:amidohydrolase [Acidimicrobiia bacterium]